MDFLTELYAGLRSGAMNILRMWTIIRAMLIVISFSMTAPSFAVMQAMDDQALSQETGQAAFYTAYTAPSGAANSSTDFGFFTLGLNGTMELNANIQHLQLGCGGINGPGCDIDMSNVSLSGPAPACAALGTCPAGTNVANTDAVLTNPFIRLAIKNPTSLSTRSLAGFQLGAQQVLGLLQAGTNTGYANGINALSGYLQVQSTAASPTLTGTVNTAPGYFPVYATGYSDPNANYTITGQLNGQIGVCPGFFCANAATARFYLSSGGFWIPGFSGIGFSVPAPVVNGSRLAGITVSPTVSLPNAIAGYPAGTDTGCVPTSACTSNNPTPAQNSNFAAGQTPTNASGVVDPLGPGGTPGYIYCVMPGCNPNKTTGSSGSYPVTGGTVGTQGGNVVATTYCAGLFGGCSTGGILGTGAAGSTYNTHMYGQVQNITANVSFLQPLGFIHSIPINSPLSLSLQSTPITWPGSPTADVAQPGWWMSVNDPVVLGNLQPSSSVSLCPNAANSNTCVFPQFAAQFNKFLGCAGQGTTGTNCTNPVATTNIGNLISGQTLGVNFGVLALTPINLGLNGVQLSSQGTLPNCYGGLKFCFLIPILGWRRVLRKKVIRRSNV